jgi:hypothetical protein
MGSPDSRPRCGAVLMPRTKLPPVAERDVLKACLDYLALRGWLAWRNNTGAFAGTHNGKRRFVRFGMPGASDILGLIPNAPDGRCGVFLAIETKRPGKPPTEAQDAFLANVRAAGGVALVVHSLDELIQGLESEGVI